MELNCKWADVITVLLPVLESFKCCLALQGKPVFCFQTHFELTEGKSSALQYILPEYGRQFCNCWKQKILDNPRILNKQLCICWISNASLAKLGHICSGRLVMWMTFGAVWFTASTYATYCKCAMTWLIRVWHCKRPD